MRGLLRNTAINTFALFLLPMIIPGVIVRGGFLDYVIGGLALSLLFLILKPILNILSLPINLVTFGLFSIFTNVIILYILTVLVPSIIITWFVFPGVSFAGFIVPKITFNVFFAYVVSALTLSLIATTIRWLFHYE